MCLGYESLVDVVWGGGVGDFPSEQVDEEMGG